MKKPKCCGDCRYRKKLNPEENMCKLDNHIFYDTLSVIAIKRDRDCPLDKKEGKL